MCVFQASGIDDKSAVSSLIREKEAANAAVHELQAKLKQTQEVIQTQVKCTYSSLMNVRLMDFCTVRSLGVSYLKLSYSGMIMVAVVLYGSLRHLFVPM